MPVRLRLRALVGRWLWFSLSGVVMLILSLLVGLRIVLKTEEGSRWMRFLIVGLLSKALNTDVRIGKVQVKGLATLYLEDLSIDDLQCAPLVRVGALRASWYPALFWQGLWKGRILLPLSYVEIDHLRVYLYHERASGLLNIDRLFPPDNAPSPRTESRLLLYLPQLLIREGSFVFRDSTVSDPELTVQKGYMNYANLQLSHLSLSASVERYEQSFFLRIWHLSVRDTAAGVSVDTLQMVLTAYPSSTIVDGLYLRTGASRLKGQAKFFYEGLDRLFLSTDTKQFMAQLAGQIAWEDIEAFSGDTLPLRGQWRIDTEMEGDLRHFRWRQLDIQTAEGVHLRTAGEIWHYARPRLMYWDVRVQEAELSLGALGATLPQVAGWPESWDTLHSWQVSGRCAGALRSYWVQAQLPGARVIYSIEKADQAWSWQGEAWLSGWSLSDLMPEVPLRKLYGEVGVQGRGFDWEHWTGSIQVALEGLYDTLSFQQLTFSAEASEGKWSGGGSLETPLLSATLQGSMDWGKAPLLQVSGKINHLSTALWGSEGSLSGLFRVDMDACTWDELTGRLRLQNLVWRKADTTLSLGGLSAQVKEGDSIEVLSGADMQLRAVLGSGWEAFFQQVEAIVLAGRGWAAQKQLPALPESLALSPFQLSFELKSKAAWAWLHLMGLPEDLEAGATALHLSWDKNRWELGLEVDSVILSHGDLHEIRLEASGEWRSSWPFTCELRVGYGEQYFLFQELQATLTGAYPEGSFGITALIGQGDSLKLNGHWQWPGGEELRLSLLSEASFFTLGEQHWHFGEEVYVTRTDGAWQWQLDARSLRSQFSTRADPSTIKVEVQALSLYPLLEDLGIKQPLEGLLSLRWTKNGGGQLSLQVDSLKYAGQSYPALRLFTQTERDTLPFQLFWGEESREGLTGTGWYVPADSLNPLSLRLSGNLPARWLSPFTGDYLEGLRGFFRFSRLTVSGSLLNPHLAGDILLDRVGAYIPFLRLAYVADGVIKCRADTLWAVDLPLEDPFQKLAYLNGYMALRAWTSPYLNLALRVRQGPVRVLSTRASSEAYLYGQALIERAELFFKGPWNAPQINGSLRFAEGTDLTLPVENYLRTERRSYVRFAGARDASHPHLQAPAGIALQVGLLSAPAARFRVLFDSRTGDEIVATGNSNLSLRISPEGTVTVSGSYEVASGEYRFSLRGIVARKLRLETGSRITWDGDLYEGRLEITATYRTFTSLRIIDSTYTATVPVDVRLFLGGTLLNPELRFQVEIPSLTGNPSPVITLFLQRLQNDEQERNRQVFALLALGSFLPTEQGLPGAQAGGSVRSTLSEFISAQLSGLLGQLVGSQVGLGVSVGQWNEISTQVRLSLGGRFTVEREGVVIAPGQASPSLGNLSARYRILPSRITGPTQLQLEAEAFSRQTFIGGSFGSSTQGMGLSLRKSFFLPPRRPRPETP